MIRSPDRGRRAKSPPVQPYPRPFRRAPACPERRAVAPSAPERGSGARCGGRARGAGGAHFEMTKAKPPRRYALRCDTRSGTCTGVAHAQAGSPWWWWANSTAERRWALFLRWLLVFGSANVGTDLLEGDLVDVLPGVADAGEWLRQIALVDLHRRVSMRVPSIPF